MLTVYDFNRVTFAHHRGIVPPMPAQEGKKAVEKRYVCSANMKLMEYGYIMARDLFDACCKAEYNDFLKTWSALYDCVTEDGKAISQTSPIWPNFPDDAMEADLVDLYVVNFLHYLTCGEWQPDFDPTKFCPALDRSHLPAVKQIPHRRTSGATFFKGVYATRQMSRNNFPRSHIMFASNAETSNFASANACI